MKSLSISLDNLRFHADHGLFPQEKKVGGVFIVSLDVDIPADIHSLRSDSIDSTVSYADLYEIVRTEISVHSDLLENVAFRIADAITSRFPVISSGSVSVTKENPPIPGCTGSATVTLRF